MEDWRVACHYCSKEDITLRRCGRCYSVYYCSKACQSIDWHKHKANCRNLSDRHANETKKTTPNWKTSRKTKPEQISGADDNTFDHVNVGLRADSNTEQNTGKSGEILDDLTTLLYDKYQNDDIIASGEDSDNDMDKRRKKSGESESKLLGSSENLGGGSERNICAACSSPGCTQKCSRCKETFYCSKQCQKGHWTIHKPSCEKKLTEEDEQILRAVKGRHDDAARMKKVQEDYPFTVFNTLNPHDHFFNTLTRQQALQTADRPVGSLPKAARMSKILYPLHEIVTEFDDIPSEQMFPFPSFLLRPRSGYVLLAFIHRYHEHVMRHGVYLRDAQDKRSKVEFYLDHVGDNPFPFFSYSQIKPGGYICLRDPVMHIFMDGSVGIRINNPEEVTVLNMDMVMRAK